MSGMETIAEPGQGHDQLHHAGNSDVSDLSYQTSDGFPGTRQSSINTEPLTLDSEEIVSAKCEAEHVLESVGPEEAIHIFTKFAILKQDLQVQNGEASTEGEMSQKVAKKMTKQAHNNMEVQNEEAITEEEVTHQFDNNAEEIVEANGKLAQAILKVSGAPLSDAWGNNVYSGRHMRKGINRKHG